MRPITKSVLAATASGAMLMASAVPADANTRRFDDSKTDTASYINIYWLRVDNSTSAPKSVQLTVRIRKFAQYPTGEPKADELRAFIDTRGGNPGPEYKLVVSQADVLFRVKGWSDRGTYIDPQCGGSARGYYSYRNVTTNTYHVKIRRGCIGNPGRVRVSVRTSNLRKAHDWAKAQRQFYPWVGR